MELSVNILSWNNKDTIYDCVRAVKNELSPTKINYEIIHVDNGSDDGSGDIATIKNEKNLGISAGKNQGIDASKGEYIMLLDGDIIPVPNSIICLLEYMREHNEVEALGFFPQKWTIKRNKPGEIHHEEYCHNLYEVQELKVTCIYYGMFKRSIFKDKGLRFDESGVMGKCGYGWEDHDFYEQMRREGIKQYAAHINNANGQYFHNMNSSIRAMGQKSYHMSQAERKQFFKEKWFD